LDEPLSNLDAKLRVQMRAELKLLFARLATTVVYVTHDQAEAMTMSDRVAIFDKGVVQQVGTALELYNDPVNLFVAGFLGSPPMNFLDADVMGGSLAGEGFSFPLPTAGARLERGRGVTIGIRPEDVVLSEGDGGVPTDVTLVEPMGSATIVYVPLAGRLIAVETDKATALTAGSRVSLAVPPDRLHLFDRETERAITVAG
jgi:ABC-type sugar transport system ATPase subunit